MNSDLGQTKVSARTRRQSQQTSMPVDELELTVALTTT